MLTITVFGTTPPCAKCKRAEREAHRAAEMFPGQVDVRKLDALGPEADAHGIVVTPMVVLGDRVIASGGIARADELRVLIAKALEADS